MEDILYFSHKLIKHMTDLSTGRHAAKTKNALDFRVGKKILKNFANNNKLAAGTEQSIIDLSAAVRAKRVPRLGPCTHDMTAPTFVLRLCVWSMRVLRVVHMPGAVCVMGGGEGGLRACACARARARLFLPRTSCPFFCMSTVCPPGAAWLTMHRARCLTVALSAHSFSFVPLQVFKRNATQLAVGTNNQAVISRHTMQLLCQGLGFSLSAGEIDNVYANAPTPCLTRCRPPIANNQKKAGHDRWHRPRVYVHAAAGRPQPRTIFFS